MHKIYANQYQFKRPACLYVVFYGLKQQPWETPPSRKSELVQAFTIQVYLDLLVGEVIVG